MALLWHFRELVPWFEQNLYGHLMIVFHCLSLNIVVIKMTLIMLVWVFKSSYWDHYLSHHHISITEPVSRLWIALISLRWAPPTLSEITSSLTINWWILSKMLARLLLRWLIISQFSVLRHTNTKLIPILPQLYLSGMVF